MTKTKMVNLIERRKKEMFMGHTNNIQEYEGSRKNGKPGDQEIKARAKQYYFCYEELDSILDQIRA